MVRDVTARGFRGLASAFAQLARRSLGVRAFAARKNKHYKNDSKLSSNYVS